MTVGVYTLEIHLPASRSLKEKRQVLRRLKDRLRARHNVAVAELPNHAEKWQRAVVVFVSVATRRDVLERLFESIRGEAERLVPGQIIDSGREYVEGADGGDVGWQGDWD